MGLVSVDPSLFFSKQDPEDPRLGELALSHRDPQQTDVQIFGWPDDEGIRLNGGRPGAAEAPDRIRRSLYRMTPSLSPADSPRLWDRGNLRAAEISLTARHEQARELCRKAYEMKHRCLSLGGGHDYGFPDSAAFVESALGEGKRPLVINFDAHLDVRPFKTEPHSGTPFRRLLTEFGNRFDFLEIGLQPQCNSRQHAAWAESQGAELWWIHEVSNLPTLQKRLSEWAFHRRSQPTFLSLDIDAIESSHAPGCSQSWAFGMEPRAVQICFQVLAAHVDLRGLGIYEVSPPLDQDDRTSKLAALFAYQFLFLTAKAGRFNEVSSDSLS